MLGFDLLFRFRFSKFARSDEELGDKRPLTGWSDSGSTTMPGFAWNEWTNQQVHRIHDLMDINTLRLAKEGIDQTNKTMVWNLSQNVDRDTMGKLGLCQCLTPTGDFYVTNRGGPLTGEELLLLQGIPADDLLLTKEAEDQLKDLAGNAMSTTVVGACILSALVLAYQALPSRTERVDLVGSAIVPSLVPRPLAPATGDVCITQDMGKYENKILRLGPLVKSVSLDFFDDAHSSASKCVSEGFDKVLSTGSILICQECDHTSSEDLATPPRKYEEHAFVKMEATSRVLPDVFRRRLLDLLPMCFELEGLDLECICMPPGLKPDLWKGWKTAVQRCNGSFRFAHEKRSRIWTCLFETADGTSRLELRISRTGAVWLLFAKAPAQKGSLRETLESPVARMCIKTVQDPSAPLSLLDGKWEICLPVVAAVDLLITGVGNRVPSWRSNLGLKGDFQNESRYEKLKISVKSTGHEELSDLISGEYRILPRCGGACGSLHKRVRPLSPTGDADDMFFFLESGRRTLASEDFFVFSTNASRTEYGEYREVALRVNPGYRPWVQGQPQSQQEDCLVKAYVPGQWTSMGTIQFGTAPPSEPRFQSPSNGTVPSVSMSNKGWRSCPEILGCDLPIPEDEKLHQQCSRGTVMEVNLRKSKRLFQQIAFVTSRLSIPEVFSKGWLPLVSSKSQRIDGETCDTCAPSLPTLRWAIVSKGGRQTYVPVEDGRAASVYEQALKSRPHPWKVQLRASQHGKGTSSLQLQVGCNAVSLVNRALGLFPKTLARERCLKESIAFEWRIVAHTEKQSGFFPKLTFTSNKKSPAAMQPPNFSKYQLRPEQLRSLSWMVSQEASNEPFLEEEVCENILPTLNWRAEGRVKRPVLVRGGIIADEVLKSGSLSLQLPCVCVCETLTLLLFSFQ
jgi:hypothetical protein